MKLDIRQILDIVNEAGFTLTEKGKPQSKENWNIDSVYEFESGFKTLSLTFTIDPLPGYLSSMSPSKRKQKLPVTRDTAEIQMTNKESGESTEYELDMRNSNSEEIDRLKRFITL